MGVLPVTRRIARRRAQIGLSDADYDALLHAQGGGCAICGATPKRTRKDGTPYRLQTDHDHATGKVRGLLCHRCNRALPAWVTAEWLTRAASYVDPTYTTRLWGGLGGAPLRIRRLG